MPRACRASACCLLLLAALAFEAAAARSMLMGDMSGGTDMGAGAATTASDGGMGGDSMGGMDMGGMDMGGMDMGRSDGGMVMSGGGGSKNMEDPCYTDPLADSCVEFVRSEADWDDDLTQLCDAMPFMPGCSLWQECQAGTASGEYCAKCSLTANICLDMPRMRGCEAYNALCGNDTLVAQCSSPGPIPDVVMTYAAKDAIDSLCYTHCMDGCGECPAGRVFGDCKPLPVLARMCYEMPGMPECEPVAAMCSDPVVAAGFPQVCTNPPPNQSKCP